MAFLSNVSHEQSATIYPASDKEVSARPRLSRGGRQPRSPILLAISWKHVGGGGMLEVLITVCMFEYSNDPSLIRVLITCYRLTDDSPGGEVVYDQ